MALNTVVIDKREFVGNLFWQALARPRDLKKEAIEIAKKNECDLYLVRSCDGIAQAGLAHSQDGYKAKHASFAASIAKGIHDAGLVIDGQRQKVTTWIGAFDLGGDKWAFVAVRDNAIMPTGDVFGERSHVLDLLEQNYGLGGWAAVVGAPELSSSFHNFVPGGAIDFLPKSTKGSVRIPREVVLTPLKFSFSIKTAVKVIAALTLIGGAISGYVMWQKEIERQEREAAIERARAEMAAQQKIAAAGAQLPHPWASIPLPIDLAEACEAGLVIYSPGGWGMSSYSCGESAVTYAFDRGASTIANLKAAMPEANIDKMGDKASLRRGIKYSTMADEALLKADDVSLDFLNTIQQLRLPVKLSEELPPPPKQPLPGEQIINKQEPPKPEWRTFSFEVGPTKLAPSIIASEISRPGIRLKQVTYRDGVWTLTGAIYAR